MQPIILLSAAAQVAAYLRAEVQSGQLRDFMPGVGTLAAELGVNRKTVEAAMRHLEDDGLLVGQGVGRKRRIAVPNGKAAHSLRVAILGYEPLAQSEGYTVELQHLLREAGHDAFFAKNSLMQMEMNVSEVRRLVGRTKADAWVIFAGSTMVLQWFVEQEIPAFALYGRRRGLAIAGAGPDKVSAYATATRALMELGHRRIVLLSRTTRRLPEPGHSERAFLNELKAHGIITSEFNLPDWKDSIEGFHARLDSLFGFTPPTALIVDESPLFIAAQQFLGKRKLQVPEDVSLVCTDDDRNFSWCKPSVSHIYWDTRPVLRRIVRWTNNVSMGRKDLRQTLTPAEFVPGGTIGPVKQ